MIRNKVTKAAFFLMAAVQMAAPVKMVYDNETVLREGKEYKFKTAPIDPNDPFRGKYITLQFTENSFRVPLQSDWKRGEIVYVVLKTGADGFARIRRVSKDIPSGISDYVKARAGYRTSVGGHELDIDYPFDRFYMEESKAPAAEQAYFEIRRDTTQQAYALVAVKNGEAVLKDVMLNEISIRELVRKK